MHHIPEPSTDESRLPRALIRAYALASGSAAVAVAATSELGLNLWFVRGRGADVLLVVYLLALAFLAVRPAVTRAHLVTLPLAALFWAGRAKAFLDLVVGESRADLIGSIFERASMVVLIAVVHLLAVALFQSLGHIDQLRVALAQARDNWAHDPEADRGVE